MSKSPKHNAIILKSKENATHCSYCGRSFDQLGKDYIYANIIKTIDHFYPTIHGGKNKNSNKVICCSFCNEFKGSIKPVELIKQIANDKNFIRSRKKSYPLYDFSILDIFIKNLSNFIDLQRKAQMNSDIGYYIQVEETIQETKTISSTIYPPKIITVQTRIKKPLETWLTYGRK